MGANISGASGARQEPEEESTSGVSTYDSTKKEHELIHYDRPDKRELYQQLGDLESENKRSVDEVFISYDILLINQLH